MDARKTRLVDFVLQATDEQITRLENVAFPTDLYSKLKASDPETTEFITSLPVGVVVNLFKYLSVKDALKLCALNKAFGRWCKEEGLIKELRRNQGIRNEYAREYARKVAFKFTGTYNIMMEFRRGDEYVRLDDRNGDSGVDIKEGSVAEALSLLPTPKTVDTFGGGFGVDEMTRFNRRRPQNPTDIVNTFQRRSTEPNTILVVTREQLTYWETFFYNMIKAGWVLSTILNTTETGRDNPVVETINNRMCRSCKTSGGFMYACSACETPFCKPCGVKHMEHHH